MQKTEAPPTTYHLTKDKLKVREWNYTGTIAVVELLDPKKHDTNSVCHALVLTTNHQSDQGSIVIWFVGTPDEYRRQGYATKLVEYLQSLFDEIITQWATNEGKNLMLKCGFKLADTQLVWKKENDNGNIGSTEEGTARGEEKAGEGHGEEGSIQTSQEAKT